MAHLRVLRASVVNWLFHLDQLDRLAARAFDHHRAGVAEAVGPIEESDSFALQLGDPDLQARRANVEAKLAQSENESSKSNSGDPPPKAEGSPKE